MGKQNTKTTVPLDVVPERRTERYPPKFRPVGRFCEVRFIYLSSPTGRDGEISLPLDHKRQILYPSSDQKIGKQSICHSQDFKDLSGNSWMARFC